MGWSDQPRGSLGNPLPKKQASPIIDVDAINRQLNLSKYGFENSLYKEKSRRRATLLNGQTDQNFQTGSIERPMASSVLG